MNPHDLPFPARDDSPVSYELELARGNISGQSSVNKFGRNIEVDSGVVADIWDGGFTVASGGTSLLWVAPTQARTHVIASTSASDTSGGVGARTVILFGLTSWATEEVSETVTLNTGTPPTTVNSYVIIHRMKVSTWGATDVNVGAITATASTDSTVTSLIRVGQGQTEMAIYGFPSTQTAYVRRMDADINSGQGGGGGFVDFDLLVNAHPDVQLNSFSSTHPIGLSQTGTSAISLPFLSYKKLVGPSIVKVQATSATNNMDISAGFDLTLVNN